MYACAKGTPWTARPLSEAESRLDRGRRHKQGETCLSVLCALYVFALPFNNI